MANVKTFNLTIYLGNKFLTFRGISRVAVKRYIEHYRENELYSGHDVGER
jgi:hypothetical protein